VSENFSQEDLVQDLQAIGKSDADIADELAYWHSLHDGEIDELIEYYEEEVHEFFDVLPMLSRVYMSMVIKLRMDRIKNKYCDES